MKRLRIKVFFFCGLLVVSAGLSSAVAFADDAPAEAVPGEASGIAEVMVPRSELDRLKTEWEAVREQQIQMIREKEDQLEKLKEEIFAKTKALETPASPASVTSSAELEAQKAALQDERKKFFQEMNRQKESLQKLQSSLDEKAKQLEAERQRFEEEKKAAAR